MVLCPPFPNKEQDTGPIILVIIILQKIRYTAHQSGDMSEYLEKLARIVYYIVIIWTSSKR
jgi:hypothetical protein